MMNKLDVEMYLYKQLKYFVQPTTKTTGSNVDTQRYIIKTSDDTRVVAVCKTHGAAFALSGFDTNVYPTRSCPDTVFADAWKIVTNGNESFESYEFKSTEEFERILLLNQKAIALDFINEDIRNKQLLYAGFDPYQYHIYAAKYAEAMDIINNKTDTSSVNKFPYISSYAKYKNINIIDAAKEVIFKKEAADCVLAQLDIMRIEYTNKICNQDTHKGIKEVYDAFIAERPEI